MEQWVLPAYAFAGGVGGAVGIALTTHHDRRESAFVFGLFALSLAVWAASNAGRMLAQSFEWMLLFTQLSYIGVLTAPIAWFAFTLRYTGHREWLTRRRLALLSVIPLLSVPFIFTSQYHSVYYSSITLSPGVIGPSLTTTPGIGYIITVGYLYCLLMTGIALLIAAAFAAERLYRRQSITIVVCVLVPMISTTLYLLGIGPIPNGAITPITFAVVSIPLGVVVHHTEIEGIAPIAHERIFQTLDDPVFVCDPNDRIIELNQAACELVGENKSAVEHQHLIDELPTDLVDNGDLHPDLTSAFGREVQGDGSCQQYVGHRYDVDPRLMRGSQGTVLMLTDISHQKQQQEKLARRNTALAEKTSQLELKNEQLERLADVIAHDLKTPLSTAESLLNLIEADSDYADDPELRQSLSDLEMVHERLWEFSETIPTLARESADVESTTTHDLERLARSAWEVVETGAVSLSIADSRSLEADSRRLKLIFENLFRNAVEHGSGQLVRCDQKDPLSTELHANTDRTIPKDRDDSGVTESSRSIANGGRRETVVSTVTVGALSTADGGKTTRGFYIEDDGRGIPEERRDAVLEFGVSTGSGTGYGLAIVRAIVEAHGWSLSLTASSSGGARFEITTGRG
ncbi:ATP-binding protein [Halococcus dombrowskii]|uniref:histidine kinase n=1 Tax=Halococcus dombrowskii TaxID=179637 RepID=A0AAV3SM79_HALDO|nr:histidine kinase N-terminal 7TM domain-containing protein [Halococcus dombrowskii]UOO95503.1 ATP-binding protein [Halococcus dombrowskii]